MIDLRDYDLTGHNTFGLHASCRRWVEYSDTAELKAFVRSRAAGRADAADASAPLLHIGGGSNLLLTADFGGTILHSRIAGISVEDAAAGLVRVGAGVVWDDFVAWAVANGFHGAECLSAIPGEVGASAVQNIGAYGAEAKDIIYKVEAVDLLTGDDAVFAAADCGYGYRQSRFKTADAGRYAVTYVTYRLSRTFTPQLEYRGVRAALDEAGIGLPTPEQLRQTIINIRAAKLPDPKVEGNAGSFFKNPVVSRAKYEALAAGYDGMPHYDVGPDEVKIPAGWMIEQCGWKGRTLGRAGVHSRQALVLVNKGGATGSDIVRLCDAVRRDVSAKFGIDIEPEVILV